MFASSLADRANRNIHLVLQLTLKSFRCEHLLINSYVNPPLPLLVCVTSLTCAFSAVQSIAAPIAKRAHVRQTL